MAVTNCTKRMREGVVDSEYFDRRLDVIEARIDDLCGLLGSVLEALGIDSVETPAHPCTQLRLIGGDDGS